MIFIFSDIQRTPQYENCKMPFHHNFYFFSLLYPFLQSASKTNRNCNKLLGRVVTNVVRTCRLAHLSLYYYGNKIGLN